MDVYITQMILGIIGNCVGVAFYLTRMPTFIRMLKTKSIEEQSSPTPYLVTLMSCLVWILYGIPEIHPYSTTILYLNGVGTGLQTTILITYIMICNRPKQRVAIIVVYAIEVLVVAAIALVSLTVIESTAIRTLVVGLVGCLVNIVTYAYPLFVMVERIIKTKTVEGINIWLILATVLKAIIWGVYAFFPLDPFMAIANGICLTLGLLQMLLYVIYTKKSSIRGESELSTAI